ncbi:branched-chain amino acid ABC transporter substrate-binding protein [Bosea vestrisii]|uniref:branched-chain amino acid ABC transporter substrate-binding protein n=1 Tax=Bosea vestrisii TaxID=151416 RepID=UPI0024DF8342|nr:branched-chain amino acid ABC transporter substrate-binding protein [Bosea vestrisii]WID95206.1 branched-chain amino acid ABC transporter substrate-binding protein [Bosea vestrisii]
MNGKPISFLAAVAMAAMSAGGATAQDITLGIIAPMSGQLAGEGKDLENAIKLAVSKLNAAGGIAGKKITTVTADDACDPQQAAAAASKLVSSNVTAVVGGYCSGAVLPTLRIYGDARVPFVIVGANSTRLVEANPGNAFLVNSTGDAQAVTAIELFGKKGFKTLAIVDEGDAYSADLSRLIAGGFEKAGGKVVAKDTVATGEQDFSALVSRIRAAKPDAVLWTAYHGGGALLTRQLRQAGFTGAIVLGDGNNSPEYLKIAGSASEGVYLFSPPVLEFLPDAKNFQTEYKSASNRDPGAYAALAFDAANVAGDAISRAGSTNGTEIIKALKATNYKGLAGVVQFTDKNTLAGSNFATLQAKAGRWTLAQ